VESLAAQGIRCEQSAEPKSSLYTNLLPLLNSNRIELLDHTRLVAQLCGLERRTTRSGRDSIDHAPGGHDDLAAARTTSGQYTGSMFLANLAPMNVCRVQKPPGHNGRWMLTAGMSHFDPKATL
jgi:hypothetical protein